MGIFSGNANVLHILRPIETFGTRGPKATLRSAGEHSKQYHLRNSFRANRFLELGLFRFGAGFVRRGEAMTDSSAFKKFWKPHSGRAAGDQSDPERQPAKRDGEVLGTSTVCIDPAFGSRTRSLGSLSQWCLFILRSGAKSSSTPTRDSAPRRHCSSWRRSYSWHAIPFFPEPPGFNVQPGRQLLFFCSVGPGMRLFVQSSNLARIAETLAIMPNNLRYRGRPPLNRFLRRIADRRRKSIKLGFERSNVTLRGSSPPRLRSL